MPGTSATGTPTRSQIESWDVGHLESAATHWAGTAEQWESHFGSIQQGMLRPGGTAWEGPAADAAQDRAWADLVKVRGLADGLHSASGFARNGADDIAWAKRQAVTAIDDAEQAGFTVSENLSVTDRSMPSAVGDGQDRQTQAKEFAHDIQTKAQALATMDKSVANQITAALAPLQALDFPEGGKPDHEPTVQAVDYGFKQDTPTPNPKDPNPNYPNRTRDGKYGDGNSFDGKAAEKAALDKRQKDLGIPIIRDQVVATHPDVINDDTKKPQGRLYDGLEPTGVPGEYIGVEAKTHEGVDRTKAQKRFDDAVSPEHPATAMLNGQPIKIVGTDVAYPPEGWVPPAPGTSPFAGAEADATVPSAGPAPVQGSGTTSLFPNWGTHITPEEASKGGGEVGNLGKFGQGMSPPTVNPSDPNNTA
ncbi:WXG100 family type VII secretion target [Mycolicibacterium sp. HS_4_1]